MKDKTNIIAIVLVIITIVVVLSSYFLNQKEKEENVDINIVTNYSNFYTVNSCLYRVINYIADKNTNDLYLVLNDNYKENNNISKENVLDIFESVEDDSTFVSTKMYYQDISENITKYYVEGYIEKNRLYQEEEIVVEDMNNIYFIIYLDKESKTFSIEPYSGEIFKSGDLDE